MSMLFLLACSNTSTTNDEPESPEGFSGAPNEVKIITLDPGHFHAALVQKSMYEQVDPNVYVYAPEGPDAQDHLNRIANFNEREDSPTSWNEVVYQGDDFQEKMIREQKGNVVVISGNNQAKTDYIHTAVEAGFNVLADKPMVITPEAFALLEKSFELARENDVLLYDIMTERYEITTMLQKELSQIPSVFGELEKGTPENPAITKESVHHFFKYVSGNVLKRPPWFFDSKQQGEGLVDISTHLVDLVQWECFPEEIIRYPDDIEMVSAKRWPTPMNEEQFKTVTHLEEIPEYIAMEDGKVMPYSNGEMIYRIKGVCAKISVIWNYQAPEGTGDTHFSTMRGTKANLAIRQGEAEDYKPVLYIEAVNPDTDLEKTLPAALSNIIDKKYPGVTFEKLEAGKWRVQIPEKYKVGHEAHFAQVTEKYLQYLIDGKLPDWEVPNMLAKYYTTTEALKLAR